MSGSAFRHMGSVALRTLIVHVCGFPLVLVAGHFFLLDRTFDLAALLLAGSAAGILAGLIPLKVYLEIGLSLVLAGLGTYAVFGLTPRSVVAFGLLYAVIHLGMRSMQYSPEDGLPARVIALGLASYLLIPIVYRLDPTLLEHARLHLAIGVAAVVAVFLLLNRSQLFVANLQSMTGPGGISPDIRLKNVLYVSGLLAAILTTANIGAISRGLSALWDAFASWLGGLRIDPGEQQAGVAVGMPEMPQFPMETEPRERSPFLEWLQEFLVYAVSGLFILLFLVLGGYLAVTQLYPFLRRLISRLNREREAVPDYLDETERLEMPNLRSALTRTLGRLKPKRLALPEDGRERVRLRYRMMLEEADRDGIRTDPALTPAETAARLEAEGWRGKPASLLVRLYNPVRYGDKDVDPRELAELEEAWDPRSRR